MVSISLGVPARWVLEDWEIDMTEGCLVSSSPRMARRRWEVGVLMFGAMLWVAADAGARQAGA